MSPLAGADEWGRARAAGLDVSAESGPIEARRVASEIAAFDPLLDATLDALGFPSLSDALPRRVLVVDEPTFEDLVPPERRGILAGVARTGHEEGRIVVRTGTPAWTIRHEAAHVALDQRLPAQPLWVAEGLADLLAAATAGEGGVTLGTEVEAWSSVAPPGAAALLAAGQDSAVYAPSAQRSFGAGAWLLIDHLVVTSSGGPLRAFLTAIAAGTARETAFRDAFGFDAAAVDDRLAAWRTRRPLPTTTLPWRTPLRRAGAVEDVTPSAAEAELAVGELLIEAGRVREAERRIDRAVTLAPASAAAHEAMAALRMKQRRLPEARYEAEQARRLEPGRSSVLVRLAQMRLQEALTTGGDLPTSEREALGLVDDALRIDPDDAAAIELRARLDPTPLAKWIARLTDVVRREPGRADAAVTLAGLHLRRYELARASEVLLQLRERTTDETLRFVSAHMMKRIAEAATGTVESRGRLLAVECPPGRPPRFRLRSDAGREVTLSGSTTTSFLVFDEHGEAGARTFTCGATDVSVVAWYRPLPDGTALLLSLALQPPLDRTPR